MAVFKDMKFRNEELMMDGNEFIGCEIERCKIMIGRGNFILKNCVVRFNEVVLIGEAHEIINAYRSIQGAPAGSPQFSPPVGGDNPPAKDPGDTAAG